MISRFLKIPQIFFDIVFSKLSPVNYIRYKGVNVKGNIFIYGSPRTMFSAEPYLITLGDNVHITHGVQFIPHDGGTLPLRRLDPKLEKADKISVGNNVFIGVNAIILPGVNIGNDCIIAAGAVVAKDIPDGSVFGGNPARFIKSTNDYFKSVKEKSLNIGDLTGKNKAIAYKKIFKIND